MFQNKNVQEVKNNKLFAGISEQDLKHDFSHSEIRDFKEGEIIFSKGDPGDFLYLILEGNVKIKFSSESVFSNLIKKSSGDFFGEKEFFEEKERLSSAISDTKTRIFPLNRNEFITIAKKSNSFKEKVLNFFTENNIQPAPSFLKDLNTQENDEIEDKHLIEKPDESALVFQQSPEKESEKNLKNRAENFSESYNKSLTEDNYENKVIEEVKENNPDIYPEENHFLKTNNNPEAQTAIPLSTTDELFKAIQKI